MLHHASHTVHAAATHRCSTATSTSRVVERVRALLVVLCTAIALAIVPHALALRNVLADDSAQAQQPTEWDLRAAFLYKFASYVQWPKEALPEEKSPLVVGVFGRDPFGKTLDEMLKDKQQGTHPISVRRCDDLESAAKCHVLYVATTDKTEQTSIVKSLKGKPVLLVGEGIEFAERGGEIAFYIESKKIRFAINTTATKGAQLEVSSQLLKLAKRIETEPEK
jgi:hypothetical protein